MTDLKLSRSEVLDIRRCWYERKTRKRVFTSEGEPVSAVPETEPYDVCRQLCERILQFEEAWDEKELELETEIDDIAMVEADESLLELVWNKLLSNAIKFTEPGGTITVKQISDKNVIKVTISDTGCGMNPENVKHIMELTRLQGNFEACVHEIDMLEKSKTSMATLYALIIGIVGTAFMAGSTFAVTAQPPHVILCIVLAIPGFLGWILPYFVYKRVVGKQTEKVNTRIEEKYDEIYTICEKGNKLLY